MPDTSSFDFMLTNKVVIITGSARGIGFSTAELLSRLGAKVMLQDIQEDLLNASYRQLQDQGGTVLACTGDISKEADIQQMISKTLEHWGRIDILVNNAGIGGVGKTLLELSKEEWNHMIEVDLTAVFLCCRAVVPHMIAQQRGSIINLASVTAEMGVAGSTHYAAAKAGVIGFSKSLAHELAPHCINVNVVAPGLIDTEMSRARGQNHMRDTVLWPRIGKADDIAWAIAYLASDRAEFVTGALLNVNGGSYM